MYWILNARKPLDHVRSLSTSRQQHEIFIDFSLLFYFIGKWAIDLRQDRAVWRWANVCMYHDQTDLLIPVLHKYDKASIKPDQEVLLQNYQWCKKNEVGIDGILQ
jgi:hypothetical protein